MTGTVVAFNFGDYLVYASERQYLVHFPKSDKFLSKPIVGDRVEIDETKGIILSIQPRRNAVKRPHLSNLDHLMVVSSMVEPTYSLLLNLMFLTYGLYYGLKNTLILTKVDLCPVDRTVQRHLDYLASCGIDTIAYGMTTGQGVEHILRLTEGKTVAFAGQTGVGKSSIINSLSPDFKRKIGEYSKALGRGKHQTKEVVLIPFNRGFIADTPGFSSLQLPMIQSELAIDFPGFKTRFSKCKFANCLHVIEEGCFVRADVKSGKIPLEIYDAYGRILEKLPFKKEFAE